MKASKARTRLQRRQRAWVNAGLGKNEGFRLPGSFKKPFPKGRR